MTVPPMIEAKVTSSLKGSILDLLRKDYQFIVGNKKGQKNRGMLGFHEVVPLAGMPFTITEVILFGE